MLNRLVLFSLKRPWLVTWSAVLLTPLFALGFVRVKIDTDPENMLPYDEPVRVFHREVKDTFGVNDLIVLGVFDDRDPQGVFTPETLGRLTRISGRIAQIDGVIIEDIISPSSSDNVTSENGFLTVSRFVDGEVKTQAQANAVREAMLDNPLYAGKLVSEDGKALAIYIPIEKKDQSYRISKEIKRIIGEEGGEEEYHIAGLPVAEDQFGYEMFIEMAISAPLAGLVIFLMLLWFFRRLSLIVAPMIVAILSIIWTMGLLTGLGFTVHIMSSMIPIFLMPIAVVDSVHILSEFHDCLPRLKSRLEAVRHVMRELFTPMLYTSLTSAVGFASLALTPIPPVRVFGLFVAFGIMSAWVLTVTFIPAYIILTGRVRKTAPAPQVTVNAGESAEEACPPMPSWVNRLGMSFFRNAKLVWGSALPLLIIAIYGITRINVNDNPVRWFKKNHEIRIADKIMNERFGGTYSAYLVLKGEVPDAVKEPEVLSYIESLQNELAKLPAVGKTSSIADIVKRVKFVVNDEKPEVYSLPASREESAQYLFLFQSSGDPDDLDNFVDYEFTSANIWVQMKSGDNEKMTAVEKGVEDFVKQNPPPPGFNLAWSGLTYLNVVWQERMVSGMGKALAGSFVTVLILMAFLFRSVLWAIISMIPLSLTIALSYGLLGLTRIDYDMPKAVLSALTIGIAIDFAIHFIQRYRIKRSSVSTDQEAVSYLFNGPSRAILRNAAVIAIGFTPLMVAPLTPYVTVGVYLSVIMVLSALATLVLLPAAIGLAPRFSGKSVGESPALVSYQEFSKEV